MEKFSSSLEVDEMDYIFDSIAESVHIELIEEGYSEDLEGCGSNQVCY